MTDHPHEFTLGGVAFRGKHLSPDNSLDAFAVVSPVFADVLKSVDIAKARDAEDGVGVAISAFSEGLRGFGQLRKMLPYFAPQYEVQLDGRWLSLATFRDETFKGKPVLQISWLVAATISEYRDFLAQSGWSTLADLGKLFGYQITLPGTGQSGG